jgi:hypothetical protein
MDMKGERRIAAPQQESWNALFDPEVLRQCIPGGESVERVSDAHFKANVKLAIGPVKARFAGDATMSEIDAPHSCELRGKGSGGVAGFGKGDAWIRLEADGAATILTYDVKASVGGKLAQVGQRLIDSTAQKLADEFFSSFVKVLEDRKASPAERGAEDARADPESTAARPMRFAWVPIAMVLAVLIAAGILLAF